MCWNCGTPISYPDPIGRSERCPDCGKDLRCCKHCKFFLPGSKGDCNESSAEFQQDKDRANFCDWFSLNPKFRENTCGSMNNTDKAKEAKTAFENLFS